MQILSFAYFEFFGTKRMEKQSKKGVHFLEGRIFYVGQYQLNMSGSTTKFWVYYSQNQ